MGISVDPDDFFAEFIPGVLREAKVRRPQFDRFLFPFGSGSMAPSPASVVRWDGSVSSVQGLPSTQAGDALKSPSSSSSSLAGANGARPQIVVHGGDGQVIRGKKKKKKHFRVALHKSGAERMIGGMHCQAVGYRVGGIGAAQK